MHVNRVQPLYSTNIIANMFERLLLKQKATTLLSNRWPYSRPEVAIVACGPRPQGFISHNSKPNPGRMVTLECSMSCPRGDKSQNITTGSNGTLPVLTIKLSIYKSLNDCLLSQSNIQSKKLFFR